MNYQIQQRKLDNNGEDSDEESQREKLELMKRQFEQRMAIMQGQKLNIDDEMENVCIVQKLHMFAFNTHIKFWSFIIQNDINLRSFICCTTMNENIKLKRKSKYFLTCLFIEISGEDRNVETEGFCLERPRGKVRGHGSCSSNV